MVAIYICEDQSVFQKAIKETIEKYIMIQAYDMHIELVTADPYTLLAQLGNQSERALYFLDVDLKNEDFNGFKLGKELRKIDTRGFLIYVTDHSELLAETFSYRLEAMDYIVKGDLANMQQRIRECLDSAHERLLLEQKETRQYLPIKVNHEVFYIANDEILFIETSSQKHKLVLYTSTEQMEFFGNLQELETELGEEFLRVHRSYLVQLEKIQRIDFNERLLYFEEELCCSFSRQKKKVLKEWHNCHEKELRY